MLIFVIKWNKINIGPRKWGSMEELYYFNKRSTALKLVRNCGICEDTVNPFVDDEIHNKYDKSYKYLFSVKRNFIDFVKTFMKVNLNVELTEENITLMDKESWKIFMTWVTKIFVIDEKSRIEIESKVLSEEEEDMGTLALIREEIFNDGKIVGIQQGFNDGKIEGFKDGKLSSVKKLLECKLKVKLSIKQIRLINKASIEMLEEIEKKIFEITSWEEIEEILRR